MTPFTARSMSITSRTQYILDLFHRGFPRPALANPELDLLAGICSDIHGICILALTFMLVPQTIFGFHNGPLVQLNFAIFVLQLVVFRRFLQMGYLRSVVVIESLSLVALGTLASFLMGTTRNAQALALVVAVFYSTLMLGGRYGLLTASAAVMGLAGVGYLEEIQAIQQTPVKVLPQVLTSCMVIAVAWMVATLVAKARIEIYNVASDDRDTKQAMLEELNETLEATVEARTAELKAAVMKLEQAKEAMVRSETLAGLGSLVAGVSHEMNTPMGNALLLATSLQQKAHRALMARPADGDDDFSRFAKQTSDSLGVIVRNIARLDRLVQSFRSVSVDQTSMRRRDFDLGEVLAQVRDTLVPTIQKKGIELVFNLKPGIKLNSFPGALEHVVMNLVNNAINHAFQGDLTLPPTIGILTDSDADWVEVSVRDNGVGMDEYTSRHAFDMFFTTKMGQGGTGIGLSLVHQLVTERLGGKLTLDTSPGNGVEFKILIPKQAPERKKGEGMSLADVGDTAPQSL